MEVNEIWLTIEGLEDYAFSNYGRIYNYKKQEYSVGNLNKKTGYYEKLLFKDGKYFKGGGIHKFIYEAFKGKIPKGMEINHIDCDKSNNAIWNLNLMTHDENRKWSAKKVYQYTLDGVLINEYDSALKASEKSGISLSCIVSNLTNRTCYGGKYLWSYDNEDCTIQEKVNNNDIKWDSISLKVEQYTKEGQFIAEYKSTKEAERQTGINHGNISSCCNKKRLTAGGYIWKYKSEQ